MILVRNLRQPPPSRLPAVRDAPPVARSPAESPARPRLEDPPADGGSPAPSGNSVPDDRAGVPSVPPASSRRPAEQATAPPLVVATGFPFEEDRRHRSSAFHMLRPRWIRR